MTRPDAPARGSLTWVRQHLFEVVPLEMLERPVSKPLPELSETPGVEVCRVSSSDPWRELVPEAQWRTAEHFLARGDRGYFAVVEGEYVGRIWLSRTSHRDSWSGLRIRLAPDEAYAFALQAVPRYRRLGVAAAVVARLLSDLRADGNIERVYGWVDIRNRESMILLRMVFGFTGVQTASRVHLLRRIGWQVRGSDQPRFGPLSKVGRHSQTGDSVRAASRAL